MDGHSVHVAGAEVLAASGIEVSKIRILARHPGDTILRYVAQAHLTTLRADLGLIAVGPGHSRRSHSAVHAARPMAVQLAIALSRLDAHDPAFDALQTLHRPVVVVFVQNLSSEAIHGRRAGDASHTICGWAVGASRQHHRGI